MKLFLVRHAVARDRDASRWPVDADRPLTEEGARRFRQIASRWREWASVPDEVWASPLVRAQQTASILHDKAGWPRAETTETLEPSAEPSSALSFLADRNEDATVAVVGHEPHLSALLSLLLAGSTAAVDLELKKGGCACVETHWRLRAGTGRLLWLLPPRVLR